MGQNDKKADKLDKRAAALRDNLRKRKALAKQQKDDDKEKDEKK